MIESLSSCFSFFLSPHNKNFINIRRISIDQSINIHQDPKHFLILPCVSKIFVRFSIMIDRKQKDFVYFKVVCTEFNAFFIVIRFVVDLCKLNIILLFIFNRSKKQRSFIKPQNLNITIMEKIILFYFTFYQLANSLQERLSVILICHPLQIYFQVYNMGLFFQEQVVFHPLIDTNSMSMFQHVNLRSLQ